MNCTCWYATPTQVKPHKNKGDGHFLKYYNLKQWYWNCHFEKIRLLCWQTASTCYIRQLFTKAETSRSKATSRCVDLSFFSNHENHRRTRRGSGETAAPWLEKFQGKLCFQGKHNLLKNFEWQKIFQYSEKFQDNSVFRASGSCSKILNVKSIFNTVKYFRVHSVFQGKHKLLKNPECKKYIQYSEFRATLFFRASAKLLKNSWLVKRIFNIVKNFRANSVFRASASC